MGWGSWESRFVAVAVQVLTETKQNVPGWLPNYAARTPSYGQKSRRGGGRFGGRDFRKDGGYGEHGWGGQLERSHSSFACCKLRAS